MSLAEIEKAACSRIPFGVDALPPEELARLAAYTSRQDKVAWDEELEQDFSPDGTHAATLGKVDAEIDAGHFRPLP
jgi:hypothetical protein